VARASAENAADLDEPAVASQAKRRTSRDLFEVPTVGTTVPAANSRNACPAACVLTALRENLIPLLRDNGKVAGIAADTQGMLRPFDEELAHEIEFAKGAVRCPALAPPFHVSPSIDAVDVTALLDELEWHGR
jgi:hypothetical protein